MLFRSLSDFCAAARTVRLVYFHPGGIALFPRAFKDWLTHSRGLVEQGRLRWTTMARQAEFSNRRLQVQWQLVARPGGQWLRASHAQSLAQMSWLLPASRYRQPRVLQGRAEVLREGDLWRITAQGDQHLEVALEPTADALPDGAAAALWQPQRPTARTVQ